MQEEFRADKGHFYFANVLQKSVYGTLKFTCLDPVKADTGRGFGGDTLQVFLKSKMVKNQNCLRYFASVPKKQNGKKSELFPGFFFQTVIIAFKGKNRIK